MFTAGKRLDTTHFLAGRADVDFDIGIENVHRLAVLVELFHEAHLGFAVQEQLAEHELEILLDAFERLEVARAGDIVEFGDGAVERGAGTVEVVKLLLDFFQALLLVFVVFHHVHIDGAQVLDFASKFTDFAIGLRLAILHTFDAFGISQVNGIFVGDAFRKPLDVRLQGFLSAAHIVQVLHLLDHVVAEAVHLGTPFFEISRYEFVLFTGQVALAFEFAERRILRLKLVGKAFDIGLEFFRSFVVLRDFVITGLDDVSKEFNLVGDIAEAARILRKFRILVEGAPFEVADFLILFAEHRLLFLEFIVHTGIFSFCTLGGNFGCRQFGIRFPRRLGLVDTTSGLLAGLLQLCDAQLAGRRRILLDRDGGIASEKRILHFADIVVERDKELLFLVQGLLQTSNFVLLLSKFIQGPGERLLGLGNLVLAAERAGRGGTRRDKTRRADARLGSDKAKVLTAVLERKIQGSIKRFDQDVAGKDSIEPCAGRIIRLDKIRDGTDNALPFHRAGIRRTRIGNESHESLAHVLFAQCFDKGFCGSRIFDHDGIKHVAKGTFDTGRIFGRRIQALRKEPTRKIGLVFGNPAVRIGRILRHALEHVDPRLEPRLVVLEFGDTGLQTLQVGLERLDAFFSHGALFFERRYSRTGFVHALLDIAGSRLGFGFLCI